MNKTIAQLLVGKRVRITKDYCDLKKGEIRKIEVDGNGDFTFGGYHRIQDICELIDPIIYKPEPHKHEPVCKTCGVPCGEKGKK